MIRFVKWIWWHLSGRAATERMVNEFVERFPGRCMICSYHRFGWLHGMVKDREPEPHDCIEAR